MGASRDKRKRHYERGEGIERRQVNARKKREKQSKTRLKYSIVGTIVGLIIIAVIILNTDLFYTGSTAVAIGNQKYSTAEFNYYYTVSYYNFMNTYGDYISYFFDTSQPLRKQVYDGEEFDTWADYFKDQALNSMIGVTALYEKAAAEGFLTLSEDRLAEIDESLAEYSSYAEQGGYPDTDRYLSAVYGRGFSEKLLREIMTRSVIAGDYAKHINDSFSFSSDELFNWYEENKDIYDRITYTYYYVSSDAFGFNGDGDEQNDNGDNTAAMASAESLAYEIAAAASDVESFAAIVEKLTGDLPATDTYAAGDIAYSDYAEWLLSADRKTGDVTVTETDAGYYVLLYGDRDDNRYNTVSVRHILIRAQADEETGEYTDEAKATALLEAERLLEEWRSGEATEESFAEFAALYSEDEGSAENGGLYEDIYKGMMVDEFNRFCFGNRSYGDTAIVFGENDYYAGYHIIFFSGTGEVYADMIAESKLRDQSYSEWEQAVTSGYAALEKFPLVFRKKI